MQQIYLRRQGSTSTLNTNNLSLPFHIDIHEHFQKEGFHLKVSYSNDQERWGIKAGHTAYQSFSTPVVLSLNKAKKLAVQKVKEIFDMDIEIMPETEMYSYQPALPEIAKEDVFITCAKYMEGYGIRMVPENHCLIRWVDGDLNKPDFDMNSNVSDEVKELCRTAHKTFLLDHNQRNSDFENKSWLAWLVGEKIKETGKQPIKLKVIGVREKQPA